MTTPPQQRPRREPRLSTDDRDLLSFVLLLVAVVLLPASVAVAFGAWSSPDVATNLTYGYPDSDAGLSDAHRSAVFALVLLAAALSCAVVAGVLRRTGRRLLLLGAILVAAILVGIFDLGALALSARHPSPDVDQSLTEQAARARSIDHLRETLSALPSGVSLSAHPDNHDLGDLGADEPRTCNGANPADHEPVSVSSGYWLIGIPPGQNERYFDLIKTYWTDHGWKIENESADYSVTAATPDGYSLDMNNVHKWPGALNLGVYSPCFPESATGTEAPQPTVIERPAGK